MNKEKSVVQIETTGITKLIFKYSAVSFSALLFSALYNLVDAVFVSHGVGDNAMGGVSVVFPFMILQGAFAQAVGSGAASMVSRLLGEKKYKEAGNVTFCAMIAFYSVTLLVSVICLVFINSILNAFGATSEIMPYAKTYFTVIVLGNVFSTGFSSLMRAEGKMIYSLLIWLIPTGINIVMDYILIYKFSLGVAGAAIATVISQFTSFLMSVIFFRHFTCQKFSDLRLSGKTVVEILSLGVPTLLQTGGMSIIVLAVNTLSSTLGGTMALNSFAYVSKLITFALVPINAVAQAISPIIGCNCGSGNFLRVKQTVLKSTLISVLYGIACFACSFFFSRYFLQIFTDDSSLISFGINSVKIMSPALIFIPFPFIAGTFFQAIGEKNFSLAINLSTVALIMINCVILSRLIGQNGIWAAVPIGSVLSLIVSLSVYCTFVKRKKSYEKTAR